MDVCWRTGWILVGAVPRWRVGAGCALNGIERLNGPSGRRGPLRPASVGCAFTDGTGCITTGSGTMPGVLLRVVRLCSLLVVFNTRFAVGFRVSMIGGASVMRGIVRIGCFINHPLFCLTFPGSTVRFHPLFVRHRGGIEDILDTQSKESE